MNTAEITIPLGKLVPSKANVRRVNSEAGMVELAASIEAHGLIHNLDPEGLERSQVRSCRRRAASGGVASAVGRGPYRAGCGCD